MKKKIETIIIFLSLIIFLILILSAPSIVLESVTFSLDIWKSNLFPALFPFLIISKLFINYGVSDVISECTKPFISNILGVSSKCNYIIILSLFSGFPSSAIYLNDAFLNGEINENDLEYLLSFCMFSNPLFVAGTVGALLLNNVKLGLIILISHYLSNIIIALIFKRKYKNNKVNIRSAFSTMKLKVSKSLPLSTVLKEAIMSSINVLLTILGIISISLIISNLLLTDFNEPLKSIITGTIEMTSGIRKLSSLNLNLNLKSSLILFLISFGGISIHIQILSILSSIKINYKRFVLKRILSSIISIIILNALLLY